MFGTSHCCDSSSCLSDTCEPTPALASAERQTQLFECAIRAVHSATNVIRATTVTKHTPNDCERDATNTKRRDSVKTAICSKLQHDLSTVVRDGTGECAQNSTNVIRIHS